MTDARIGTYAVVTFGCRVNQADSLAIEGDLLARGSRAVPIEAADLVIVNTCSVTASADQAARNAIRRVSRVNPTARVLVTGCYATRRPDELQALPQVASVVPNGAKDGLVQRLDTLLEPTTAQRFGMGDGACGETLAPGIAGRTAFTLRVQTGCDQSCSYCIIPTTRGTGRSRPLDMVRADLTRAFAAGYREIAITGVHLGSYGRDLGDGTSLLFLVRMLAEWDADVRFRVSSLEPMDCTREIVAYMARSPRLAPHFHLPLQHGDDTMLRAMRRPYAATSYEDLVTHIRKRIPAAAIGSDVIVGFPGETDVAFERMHALVARLPLTHLHVFPYSDRPGTEASRLPGKVEGAVIRARGQAMRTLGASLAARFRQSQAGTVQRALTLDDGWSAMTGNYLKVPLDRQHPRNEWIEAEIP